MRSISFSLRLFLLLLALCLTVSAFAGCTSGGEPQVSQNGGQTTQPPATEDPNAGLYDENGYWKDQIPEELDYNRELSILCWASIANEFGCDDYNGQAINDALVSRDLDVEDRLNVSLLYLTELIGGDSVVAVNHYVDLVKKANQSGDTYNMLALYGRTAATLSYQGLLTNIMNIEDSYLNFENPWWTANLLEELMVGKSLFLLSGDISPSIYEQPYTMFYNVNMVKNWGLDDPYELVKKNEWTIEVFREYTKNVEFDSNGNPAYGIASSYYTVPALMHGCAIRLMERDEAKLLKLSDELFSEKTIDIVADLKEWAKEDNFIVADSSPDAKKYFTDGNAMFLIDRLLECFNFNDISNFSYSVVPTPKYTSEQNRYYTTLDTQLTFFCLMQGLSAEDLTMMSAVLECLASESYRQVSPAVVKTCLEGRYAQSEQMSEMIRVIVDSVYYDFGRIYSSTDTDYLCDKAGRIIQGTKSGYETLTWSAYKNSYGPYLERQFQKIVDKYVELENR